MPASICHRTFIEKCCKMRGISIGDAMPCVLKTTGDIWTIDTSHPAFPGAKMGDDAPLKNACAAGSELKRILGTLGFSGGSDCKCNSRASYMDEQGCDWCEAHINEIVGWLREQATARGLPFVDAAGRFLVKRAIKNARKIQH
jgi:hypothetical protein